MPEQSTLPERTDTMKRLERKIVLPSQSAGFIIAWLRHYFITDPVYPINLITSLYIDTPELDSYQECLNGDVYKNKIRIRWYDHPAKDRDINAYVELKSKQGFNTVKYRKLVTIPGSLITERRILQLLQVLKLREILPGLGYLPGQNLQPVILISYRRYRFKDRNTGTSITYDTGISSRIVMPGVAAWSQRIELKPTVLELKGTTMAIPHAFQHLRHRYLQWSTFSKYARSLEAHLERPLLSEGIPVPSQI